jgi:RNA polymerase sigma factor (sigma-70 family)
MARAGLGAAFRQLRGLFGGGSVVGLEDGQLLARYASDRDEAAFEALIERHGPMVLTICRTVLKNEHDSEDAFQATFLVLARKAGSIRGADALGGWLHRVAYRASVQASVEAARRRRKEAEAQTMAAQSSPQSDTDREIQALLHAEIDRLPDSQRLPVVLCDLEGLTYEQAATRLRWTVPTLRNRLARGRQRLKTRLTRRGLMAPALIGLASVPPALVKSTLSAATGGAISTGAALLARILLKGMLMTKLKVTGTCALATLVLVSAGVIATDSGKIPDEPKLEIAIQEPRKPVEPVEVRGIVLTPDGQPVAGAKVWANVVNQSPETTSGPDGKFLLKVLPRDPSLKYGDNAYPCVMAMAPGFGLGWFRNAFDPGPSGELTVRLGAEGPPIEGRIIDSENRPIAGAVVKVKSVWVDDRSSVVAWIAKLRAQEVSPLPLFQLLNLQFLWPLQVTAGPDGQSRIQPGLKTPVEVKTGPDGRFRLTGLGGDRLVNLVISGSTLATTEMNVLAYDGPEIQVTPRTRTNVINFMPPRTSIFLAPKFEAVVGPGRSTEGVIRDMGTSRPIEGLIVQAGVVEPPGNSFRLAENVLSVTDAQGRYRLDGMPRAASYSLEISGFPDAGLPYEKSTVATPDDPNGTGPVHHDIALKRAVVVRGRVTDKQSGEPVMGVVEACVFDDDPLAAGVPANRVNYVSTRPDGRFEIVTPPGRGLLAFRAAQGGYFMAIGAPAIKGFDPKTNRIRVRGRDLWTNLFNVVTEVNLDPKAESATVNLQVLDASGPSLELKVVDPEDRPITGLRFERLRVEGVFLGAENGPTIKIRGLGDVMPRRVTIFHDGRKLVGSIWLMGDEVSPLTVRLGPWGTISGRFLDADGKGLGSRGILSDADAQGPQVEEVGNLPGPRTDRDGWFRIEGLVPGLIYSGRIEIDAFEAPAFKDVSVGPGEVKDLGEIKAFRQKPRRGPAGGSREPSR